MRQKAIWTLPNSRCVLYHPLNILAEKGTNCNFVLKHSTGHLPGNSEVDVPLSYADYYYVEALMRLKKLI